jgi:hypothetical protein
MIEGGEEAYYEALEKWNASQVKQLPPELVEKMKLACLGETYLDEVISNPLSIKCAKIAVDFSKEEISKERINTIDKVMRHVLINLPKFGLSRELCIEFSESICELLKKNDNETN